MLRATHSDPFGVPDPAHVLKIIFWGPSLFPFFVFGSSFKLFRLASLKYALLITHTGKDQTFLCFGSNDTDERLPV